MRRREQPATGLVLPVELSGPAVVEDWVAASEITSHTFAADCPVDRRKLGVSPCGGECDWQLKHCARARQRDTRDAWLVERGLPPRGAVRYVDGWPRWARVT